MKEQLVGHSRWKIILKSNLERRSVRTGFKWERTGSVGGVLRTR
jgi:hypothetical protein